MQITDLSEGYLLVQIGFWIKDFEREGKIVTEVNEKLLRLFKDHHILFAPMRAYPSLVSSPSAL